MMKRRILVYAAFAVLTTAPAAGTARAEEARLPEGTAGKASIVEHSVAAGLPQSAAPTDPDCSSARLLYAFTGVADDGDQGAPSRNEATTLTCTNMDTTTVVLEAQVVPFDGTDIYAVCTTIPAGRTMTISTQGTTIYFEDALFGGVPGTPAIDQGSGFVFSSSPHLLCTAQVLDALNATPLFMVNLPLTRMWEGAQTVRSALYYTGMGFNTYYSIFNAGDSDITATLTLTPGNGAPASKDIPVAAGKTKIIPAATIVGQNSFGAAEISWTGTADEVIVTGTTVNLTTGASLDAGFTGP